MSDSDRPFGSLAEVGAVNDLLGIDQYEICRHPFGNSTSIVDSEATRWLVCHLSHSIGKFEHTSVTHVST
jgi:hypothetical protein